MKIEKADERAVIQILRGIAIVLVVIHHVMKCFSLSNELNTLLTIINTVHVVVFFVISGWLFEKKKCKYRKNGIFLFLKKKFCQLIVPYTTFSFSFAILIWLGSHIEVLKQATLALAKGRVKSLVQIIVDIVLYRNVYYESLWFVYAMFFLMALMFLLYDDRFVRLPFVISMLLLATFIKSYAWMLIDLERWTILNNTIMYFPWMLFGRLLYTRLHNGFVVKWNIVAIAALVLSMCIIRWYYIDLKCFMGLYARAIWQGLEFLAIRLSFLALVLALSKWLIITDKYKPIEYICDMSYDIYLIHNPWIVSTLSIILKNRVTIPLAIVIGTIMTIVISVTVINVIKCYLNPIYKVYFGKI